MRKNKLFKQVKNVGRRIGASIALAFTLLSASAPAASAWTAPSWLPRVRLALADTTKPVAFVLPGEKADVVENKAQEATKATYRVRVTGYTSVEEECDSSPFITADGSDTRYLYGDIKAKKPLAEVTHLPSGQKVHVDGMIAWNYASPDAKYRVPFGTKVRLPELFGDMVFEVRDRLNERYHDGLVDVWVSDVASEYKITTKNTKLEIVQWGDGVTRWNVK